MVYGREAAHHLEVEKEDVHSGVSFLKLCFMKEDNIP